MVAVMSTALADVSYDEEASIMSVTFHRGGRTYLLQNVPKQEYERLIAAPSKGSYWNLFFKGKY
jgi:hypothetical protein